MIRQFLKIADHTFSRPEKTEALTEDLVCAEKRVDLIKQSCHSTGKKIAACLQGVGVEASVAEKRMKKLPEVLLAQCMQEWSSSLGETSILGSTLSKCASIEDLLGKELLAYESKVDKVVLNPIVNLLEVDFPNITRLRKQLTKLIQDMDITKTKYQAALKHGPQNNNNAINTHSKAETLQEELEDISMKVEQCRDSLSAELFTMISKEPELSKLFVDWYHLQVDYHRRELEILEQALPSLDSQIGKYPFKPVFGQPLEDHIKATGRKIALVIEVCICWLLEMGMDEEGLFRIAGSTSKVKKIKSAFDAGLLHCLEDVKDPHIIAGALKSYLRELPEPLMTFHLYNDWITAAEISDNDTRLQTLWRIMNNLPEANFNNLRYIIKFLAKLASNVEANKMTSHNLAIVIAPNLIWSPVEQEPAHLGFTMTMTNLLSSVVDSFITYADWFFPGDIEFFVSTPSTPHTPNGPLVFTNVDFHNSTTNGVNSDVNSTSSSNSSNTSQSPHSPRSRYRPGKKPAPPVPGNSKPTTGKSHSDRESRMPVERSLSLADVNPQKIGNGNVLRAKGKSCENLLSVQQDYTTKNGSIEDITSKSNEYVTTNSHSTTESGKHNNLRRYQVLPRTFIQRPNISPPTRPPKPNTYPKNIGKNRPPIRSVSDDSGLLEVDINDISCSFQEDSLSDNADSKHNSPVFYQESPNENLENEFKEFLSKFPAVSRTVENRNFSRLNSVENNKSSKIDSVSEIPENEVFKDSQNNVCTQENDTETSVTYIQDHIDSDSDNKLIVQNGNTSCIQTVNIPDKQYYTVIHVPGASSKPEVPSPIAKERLRLVSPPVINKSQVKSVTHNTRL